MPIAETPRTVKQHAVPQNIMQVEFKVIGELTMRQFFYLIIGAIFAFGAYKSGLPSFIAIPFALVIVLGALAVAFLPVADRGMDQWVVNFFQAVYSPTQRVWRKEAVAPKYFLYQNAAMLKSELLTVAPTASRRKLEQYLERETAVKPLDAVEAKELEYIEKVRAAFETAPAAPQSTQVQTLPPLKETQVVPELTTDKLPDKEVPKTPAQPPTVLPSEKPRETVSDISEEEVEPVQPAASVIKSEVGPSQPEPEKQTIVKPPSALTKAEIKKHGRTPYKPHLVITPDRLTGRRFTHLSPTQGEIILPIRGERIIKTTEEAINEDINEKANQLMALVEKIKKEKDKAKSVFEKAAQPEEKSKAKEEVQGTVSMLKDENLNIAKQIEDLKNRMNQAGSNNEDKDKINEQIQKLMKDKEEADTQIEQLQQRIKDLEVRLNQAPPSMPPIIKKVVEQVPVQMVTSAPQPSAQAPKVPQPKAPIADIPALTSAPNVISGVVRDKSQKLVEGAVVLIKDPKGDVVRALKTNKLGQFVITTPVANGTYMVEVTKQDEDSPQTFETLAIELKGEVLPPLEFIGKL